MQKKKPGEAAPPAVARRKRRSPEEIMDRLVQAAGEEFKRCGYAGATTATIARTAGVTEAQLFRYFGSKAELFSEAIFKPLNRHFYEFNARLVSDAAAAEPVRDKVHQYITELQQFLSEHSQMLMALVVAQTYAPSATQGVGEINSLRTYFERGAAMSTQRSGGKAKVDPKLMVRVSFAAVLACVMFRDWIFPEGLATDEEINTAVIDFVIDGINAELDPEAGPSDRTT